jgi:hypothetical protein
MNCSEFASVLIDLSGPAQGQGGGRNHQIIAAVEHANGCPRCADRLSEQQELAALLRMVTQSTPIPVTTAEQSMALHSAFRRQTPAPLETVPVVASPFGWKPWGAAIAAMFLVTVAGVLALQLSTDWLSTDHSTPDAVNPAERGRNELTLEAHGVARIHGGGDEGRPDSELTVAQADRTSGMEVTPANSEPLDSQRGITSAHPLPSEEADPDVPARQESVTAFVDLPYAGDPMLRGGGLVVRVEISGAALQTLGFPVVDEPSARRVRADLMLGEDGVARAIRLVQ